MSGEPLWLGPRAALALALAFHELATNAGKYGALSVEGGTVSIAWSVVDDQLSISWKERGGPAVAMPERRGFGSRLIERGLASDLGGTAQISFEADGLACRIEAALDAVRPQETSFG
jgi:two-component sensor histidine kinase